MSRLMTVMNGGKTVALLLFLFSAVSIFAQTSNKGTKKKVNVVGSVNDSFTGVGLKAFVTVMDSDSTVIDTLTCDVFNNHSLFRTYIPRVNGTYIIRASHDGYASKTISWKFEYNPRDIYIGIPPIKLKKLMPTDDNQKTVDMDEVVVTGTRLQVAYRGDTIVYNAAAFNIPEGAMLDALVRQLPGAEMKSNGDVYINGEKVEYITLNGNDFFKGSNKVVLENLPYFVVKELRAYHRTDPLEIDTLKKIDPEENPFVLDVVMKREYAKGVIVNSEAGAGTDNRWKAKLFGLEYTDFHRLAVFGNVNNVNEDRTPGTDGDWSPHKQGKGLLTNRQAGLNYNLNNQKKTLILSEKLLFEWTDANNETRRSGEQYSTPYNIFSGSNSISRNKSFKIDDQFQINIRLGKTYLNSFFYMRYNNNDSRYNSSDSTWAESPVNRSRVSSLSKYRSFNTNGYISFTRYMNRFWMFSTYINLSYNNVSEQDHSLRNINYLSQGTTDGRNDYRDRPSSSYSYRVDLFNRFSLTNNFYIETDLVYNQGGKGEDKGYYRFGDFGNQYEHDMLLPSTTDSLQMAFDFNNSYDYYTIDKYYSAEATFVYESNKLTLSMGSSYAYHSDWIDYTHADTRLFRRRSYGSWSPSMILRYRFGRNELRATARMFNNQPQFSILMPYTDDSNPLNIRINNPNLRSEIRSNVDVRLTMKPKKGPAWWLKYNLNTHNRARGNRVNYNRSSGVYTSIADNVNGNYDMDFSGGLTGTIDNKRRLSYDISAKLKFIHSVDFDIAYDDELTRLSKVNSLRPETAWKLNYRLNDFSFGALVRASRNFSHNTTLDVADVNIREYKFGFNTQYTIPVLKLTVGTDLSLYTQKGYSSAYMNTNDWIWNAAISRPLFNGRLVARIDGYDILHQMTTRRYSVDAQGHTETWYNTIPRYFMFSLSYRFVKKPK